MLGEDEKNDPRSILLKIKERPSKLEKGYSQDLVKQTVVRAMIVVLTLCALVLTMRTISVSAHIVL